MQERRRYRKKSDARVVAVQVKLDTDGFTYTKWGGIQTCKPGDWLVDNGGEVYTIDDDTFTRTYQAESLGVYKKTTMVWAEVADQAGQVSTKEGVTDYKAGDYIVYNDDAGDDRYAVAAKVFEELYELAP